MEKKLNIILQLSVVNVVFVVEMRKDVGKNVVKLMKLNVILGKEELMEILLGKLEKKLLRIIWN